MPTKADFLGVCSDKIIREHVVYKAMWEIYEAKRREMYKIETLHGSRVCQGSDFSIKMCFK